jgi:hypothetical protein
MPGTRPGMTSFAFAGDDTGNADSIFKQQPSFQRSLPRPACGERETPDALSRHSGMVRQHQTRNLEIPGSMLRIAPE